MRLVAGLAPIAHKEVETREWFGLDPVALTLWD
jgi:hypothetical protein